MGNSLVGSEPRRHHHHHNTTEDPFPTLPKLARTQAHAAPHPRPCPQTCMRRWRCSSCSSSFTLFSRASALLWTWGSALGRAVAGAGTGPL
jgi:hypothetical protein